jgi:hypothetical protein
MAGASFRGQASVPGKDLGNFGLRGRLKKN